MDTDHHPELAQVVLNLIVEHRSGIPVMMQAADGNQIDTQAFTQIVQQQIMALQAAHDDPLTLIADAALYTQETITHLSAQGVHFLCRVPQRLKAAKAFIQEASSDRLLALEDPGYQAMEKKITHHGVLQKWVLYHSDAASHRVSKGAFKQLAQATDRAAKAARALMRQRFACEADAQQALEACKKRYPILQWHEVWLEAKPHYGKKGRPKASQSARNHIYRWRFAITFACDLLTKARQQESGYFILATNDLSLSPWELLTGYKSQQRVERGFRFLKSPEFFCDAIFLKKPERIEALLMIMTLALLVYAALERTIRQTLKESGQMLLDQTGKPTAQPTARWVFQTFFAIHVLTLADEEAVRGLEAHHQLLLDLLGEPFGRFYASG